MQLHYSFFKYKSTTLGILFHEPFVDIRKFKYRDDLSALASEFDISVIHKLLVGIEEDIKSKDPHFDIEDFIRFYINDFYFTEICVVVCEDVDNMIDHLVQSNLI